MKVHLLASNADRSGGADIYTAELVTRLVRAGVDITLVCHHADPDVCRVADVRTVSRGAWTTVPAAWRLAPLLQLSSVQRAMRRLALPRPDVVLGMAHQLIWAHERLFGPVPLVYQPHSLIAPVEVASYGWRSPVLRAAAVGLWHRLERRYLDRAVRTIRFSHAAGAMLRDHYGPAIHPRFEVLAPPVALPAATRLARTAGPVRLLSVGRLVPSKNVRCLIDAASRLPPDGWRLDVLGDGPCRQDLASQVEALGLRDRVILHGHRPPDPFYAEADLLVTTSRLESGPLVVVEAMAYGVPTLAIRADGDRYRHAIHELVSDGVDGFLAADEAALPARLASLVRAPHLLDRAGRLARRRAAERHGWSAHVEGMIRILRRTAVSDAVAESA